MSGFMCSEDTDLIGVAFKEYFNCRTVYERNLVARFKIMFVSMTVINLTY